MDCPNLISASYDSIHELQPEEMDRVADEIALEPFNVVPFQSLKFPRKDVTYIDQHLMDVTIHEQLTKRAENGDKNGREGGALLVIFSQINDSIEKCQRVVPHVRYEYSNEKKTRCLARFLWNVLGEFTSTYGIRLAQANADTGEQEDSPPHQFVCQEANCHHGQDAHEKNDSCNFACALDIFGWPWMSPFDASSRKPSRLEPFLNCGG